MLFNILLFLWWLFFIDLFLDAVDGPKEAKGLSKTQNSIRLMKEKISLLSKRGKKLVKKEKKLKSNLDSFTGIYTVKHSSQGDCAKL